MKKILLSSILCMAVAGVASADTVVFDTGLTSSAGLTRVATLDCETTYGVTYSNFTLDSTTGYTSVPVSTNGKTSGLYVSVNNQAGDTGTFKDAACFYATTVPQTQFYDIELTCWDNYTTPVIGGGTGSTEQLGVIFQANTTTVTANESGSLGPNLTGNGINPDPLNGFGGVIDISTTNSGYAGLFNGLVFGYSGDAGYSNVTGSNIFLFDPQARPNGGSATNQTYNGQVGTWLGGVINNNQPSSGHTFGNYPAGVLSFPPGRIAGSTIQPGFLWNKITIQVRGTNVACLVNGYTIVTYTSNKVGKFCGFFANDAFTSVSNPPAQSYMLFDRFKITDITPSSAAADWNLYQ